MKLTVVLAPTLNVSQERMPFFCGLIDIDRDLGAARRLRRQIGVSPSGRISAGQICPDPRQGIVGGAARRHQPAGGQSVRNATARLRRRGGVELQLARRSQRCRRAGERSLRLRRGVGRLLRGGNAGLHRGRRRRDRIGAGREASRLAEIAGHHQRQQAHARRAAPFQARGAIPIGSNTGFAMGHAANS